jgi:lysozyme
MVVDLYHGDVLADEKDPVASFAKLKAAGIAGVILKATQGAHNHDPTYAARSAAARQAGLLVGAYHFNTGEAVADQVQGFLDAAIPHGDDKQTLLALDFESNAKSQMSLGAARAFLSLAYQKLGRHLVLYSGNRIKELLPKPRLPAAWSKYWIWQFAGDRSGPGAPHALPGIATKGIDVNTYDGTPEQLAREWAS